MRRRRYSRRNNYNNIGILRPTPFERIIFDTIISFIRMTVIVFVAVFKGLFYFVNTGVSFLKNAKIAYRNGYDVNILLDKFHRLSPRQFEVLMAELFRCQGFDKVELTQFSHDYGRDIILTKKVNGIKETVYVECKYYAPNNVIGRDICFKLLGSMQMFRADKGIVCSTGKFHKNSVEVAESVDNLELMDADDIKKMIFELNANQIQRIMFKLDNVS